MKSVKLIGLFVYSPGGSTVSTQSGGEFRQPFRGLLRTHDYERRRIARQLHDGPSQLLAALSMKLGRLCDSTLDPETRSQAIAEALELTAACAAEIRSISTLLYPPLLEQFGLVSALQTYAQDFQKGAGIPVEIRIPAGFGRLALEEEFALFKVFQDWLANARPPIAIELQKDAREVLLTLRDGGRALPPELVILEMQERAAELGGRLEVAGATVSVSLPITHAQP
jgi:signal transduction histidine kinase